MNLEKYADPEIRNGVRLRGKNITKENSFGVLVACADFKKLQVNKPLAVSQIQNDYTHNLACQTGHIQYRDELIKRTLLQKNNAVTHLLK